MSYAPSRSNRQERERERERVYFILIISRNYILITFYYCVVLFSTEQQLKYSAA
jgi:hypothetical protein